MDVVIAAVVRPTRASQWGGVAIYINSNVVMLTDGIL